MELPSRSNAIEKRNPLYRDTGDFSFPSTLGPAPPPSTAPTVGTRRAVSAAVGGILWGLCRFCLMQFCLLRTQHAVSIPDGSVVRAIWINCPCRLVDCPCSMEHPRDCPYCRDTACRVRCHRWYLMRFWTRAIWAPADTARCVPT